MCHKLKFENYKSYLDSNKFENKINHLQKSRTDMHSLKNNWLTFKKNGKYLKSEKQNLFTVEINEIALSWL